jgi:hypothetical protein
MSFSGQGRRPSCQVSGGRCVYDVEYPESDSLEGENMLEHFPLVDELRKPVPAAFLLTYFLVYRRALTTAVQWGAFEMHSTLVIRKFFLTSFVLLVILPLSLVIPLALALVSIQGVLPERFGDVGAALAIGLLIVICSQFSRAMKHGWSLVVLTYRSRARTAGSEFSGWLNINVDPEKELPRRMYSVQMLAFFSLVPLLCLSQAPRSVWTRLLSEWHVYVDVLYLSVVFAQFGVAMHVGSRRGYFYDDERPKWILNGRIPFTVLIGYVWPIWLAMVGYSSWRHYVSYSNWGALACVVPGLVAPLFCENACSALSRSCRWADETKAPEIYNPQLTVAWTYWGLFAFMLLSSLAQFVWWRPWMLPMSL